MPLINKGDCVPFCKWFVGGWVALAVLVLSGPLSCAGQAKHDHSVHDHADHSAAPDHSAGPVARDYADAIGQIQNHMTSLDAIMKAGKYDVVHKDCVATEKLSESIGGARGWRQLMEAPCPRTS